jgi:acetyl-CoA synthetase
MWLAVGSVAQTLTRIEYSGLSYSQGAGQVTHQAGGDHYQALYEGFVWKVPARLNIAQLCLRRWAQDPQRANETALLTEDESGARGQFSFAQLQVQVDALSLALQKADIRRGDRVAIILGQRVETVVAYMAIWQVGAVAMPLSLLFGSEALEYRLQDSGARLVVTDETGLSNFLPVRGRCPEIEKIVGVECGAAYGVTSWDDFLIASSEPFEAVDTAANDPAILIYTSGTTGPPKGALVPHRALIGNLTGFVASQNWFPQAGDVFWSPADWAWTGGLMDALLPSLYFGAPILGYRGRFTADKAFELMQRHGITNSFLFPTALKMMMKTWPEPRRHFKLKLRAIMSAGEAVGATVYQWCEQALGVRVNEMFGQTEVNYIVGNSDRWPAQPGSMGRPYPGHLVAVIDDAGEVTKAGELGEVAVRRTDIHGHPDPVFFLGYWNNDDATRSKFSGDWWRTGDLAVRDADGYLWYQGRADDMFKAAGYRIGPSEVENCLVKHPAVANAAVVPKPDAERGAIVKAFVVLTVGTKPSAELALQLQNHVRDKLAPYEYPKEIEFIEQLPMTTTGKVQRRVLRQLETERAQMTHQRAGTSA